MRVVEMMVEMVVVCWWDLDSGIHIVGMAVEKKSHHSIVWEAGWVDSCYFKMLHEVLVLQLQIAVLK